jgi:hypothetical protein
MLMIFQATSIKNHSSFTEYACDLFSPDCGLSYCILFRLTSIFFKNSSILINMPSAQEDMEAAFSYSDRKFWLDFFLN